MKKSFIDKLIISFKNEKTIELSNGEIASLVDINAEKYNNKKQRSSTERNNHIHITFNKRCRHGKDGYVFED